MKKYSFVLLVLFTYTAQTTAMYRKIARTGKFLKKTTIGAATGYSAVMVVANECPIRRQQENKSTHPEIIPAMAFRAGIIMGATVATKIAGAMTSIIALSLYDHKNQILEEISDIQKKFEASKMTSSEISEPKNKEK